MHKVNQCLDLWERSAGRVKNLDGVCAHIVPACITAWLFPVQSPSPSGGADKGHNEWVERVRLMNEWID
jgi:hypothetical protein